MGNKYEAIIPLREEENVTGVVHRMRDAADVRSLLRLTLAQEISYEFRHHGVTVVFDRSRAGLEALHLSENLRG